MASPLSTLLGIFELDHRTPCTTSNGPDRGLLAARFRRWQKMLRMIQRSLALSSYIGVACRSGIQWRRDRHGQGVFQTTEADFGGFDRLLLVETRRERLLLDFPEARLKVGGLCWLSKEIGRTDFGSYQEGAAYPMSIPAQWFLHLQRWLSMRSQYSAIFVTRHCLADPSSGLSLFSACLRNPPSAWEEYPEWHD
jgi:hypothetical protein